jgi:UPF0755 protein
LKKKSIYTITALLCISSVFVFTYYQKIFGNIIEQEQVLYVRNNSSLNDIHLKIEKFVKKPENFLWTAAKKNFSKPKPGRYILKKGISNNDLVNMLRSGRQTPVKISFNNQDTLEKFAGRISKQIAADSIDLLSSFKDEKFLTENNFTKKSILQIFIPNTYEFYWTVSPIKFRRKMMLSYQRFWDDSRKAKAKKLNLTPEEVVTLASIIQKETAKSSERPVVAGLYLNRLKKGWPLQADPTVIYCIKAQKGQNYKVQRVLTKDLKINSPYNTYIRSGLPPTLISMPDISSIESVLNAATHNYYYMCASVDNLGYHTFASSLSQHNKNAAQYHQWMDSQRIHR